jgi:hypothetical protein
MSGMTIGIVGIGNDEIGKHVAYLLAAQGIKAEVVTPEEVERGLIINEHTFPYKAPLPLEHIAMLGNDFNPLESGMRNRAKRRKAERNAKKRK